MWGKIILAILTIIPIIAGLFKRSVTEKIQEKNSELEKEFEDSENTGRPPE